MVLLDAGDSTVPMNIRELYNKIVNMPYWQNRILEARIKIVKEREYKKNYARKLREETKNEMPKV